MIDIFTSRCYYIDNQSLFVIVIDVYQSYFLIAFGDNLNDISMIQSAGKGYAVNTAREETKKAADEVIPGYAENGVLEVLKTFL